MPDQPPPYAPAPEDANPDSKSCDPGQPSSLSNLAINGPATPYPPSLLPAPEVVNPDSKSCDPGQPTFLSNLAINGPATPYPPSLLPAPEVVNPDSKSSDPGPALGLPAINGPSIGFIHDYNPVIVQQPIALPQDSWMIKPQGPINCPRGLEYLMNIDQIQVHHKMGNSKDEFLVRNSVGQKIYQAVEDKDACANCFLGPVRPFELELKDDSLNKVIHLNRPLSCDDSGYCCCMQSMEVFVHDSLVGSIEQRWSLIRRSYVVKDVTGDVVFWIKAPILFWPLCKGDYEFQIYASNGETKIGNISKHWLGVHDIVSTNDKFFISFPINIDVRAKAVLLGACFLVTRYLSRYRGFNFVIRVFMFIITFVFVRYLRLKFDKS